MDVLLPCFRDKKQKMESDGGSEILCYYIMKSKVTLLLLACSSDTHMLTHLWAREQDFD